MEVRLGSYSCRLEILIGIVIVAWIMCGSMLCSCCQVSLREGFGELGQTVGATMGGTVDTTVQTAKSKVQSVASKNSESESEGFTQMGFSSTSDQPTIMNVNQWNTNGMLLSPDPNTPNTFPLKPGSMDMFANTKFSPECCGYSSYSNSSGCACLSVTDEQYLQHMKHQF